MQKFLHEYLLLFIIDQYKSMYIKFDLIFNVTSSNLQINILYIN